MNKKQTQTISFKKRKIEMAKFQDRIDVCYTPNVRHMRRLKERELNRNKQ